jgi:transcriptional regulator with XRE-family HTH domain
MVTAKTVKPVDVHAGSRLRARRLQLGLSQEKIAKSVGLTFQQVQKYEKGMNRMGASRLQQFANLLDVSPGYFFIDAPGGNSDNGQDAELIAAYNKFVGEQDGWKIIREWVELSNDAQNALLAMMRAMNAVQRKELKKNGHTAKRLRAESREHRQ